MRSKVPKKLPTQKEIARLAGVSQVTVNAVLNGSNHTRTKPETRELILKIAKQLDYRIQRHARLMRTGKSGAIALICAANIIETTYLRLNHAATAVRRAGYQPDIWAINWASGGLEEMLSEVLHTQPEGMLLLGGLALMTEKLKGLLADAGIPIVSLSGPSLQGVPLFIPDYREGYRSLAGELLDRGDKEVSLVIRCPQSYQKAYRWQDERREGFLQAHEARSIAHPRIVELTPPGQPESHTDVFTESKLTDYSRFGYDWMRTMIEKEATSGAWMFANDAWAMGALRALGEVNIPVPQQVAVTGCDGESAAMYGYRPLTTLVQPIGRIVSEGVKCLSRMIETKEYRKTLTRRFSCELRRGATA